MIFLGEAASTVSPNISNLFQTTLTFTSLPPATNQDQLTFALGSASCSLCKMDRALDEIVAERHVRSRLGCPFSLALQALTKGGLANILRREVDDLADAVVLVEMTAMTILVMA
jgi:hypothetical protein